MLLHLLLIIPIIAIFSIASTHQNNRLISYYPLPSDLKETIKNYDIKKNVDNIKEETLNFHDTSTILNEIEKSEEPKANDSSITYYKKLALIFSILNLIVSLIIYILFDFSNNQFQYVQEHFNISIYDIYLGIDGISIYFVLLTTIITPIGLLSN